MNANAVLCMAGRIRRGGFKEDVMGNRKNFAREILNRLSDCGGERKREFEGRLGRYSAGTELPGSADHPQLRQLQENDR